MTTALKMTMAAVATLAAAVASAANPTARYISRTMGKLEHSTAEKPAQVKLLFYGQSIVDQPWFPHTVGELRRRYPTAKIEVVNKAIGGFTSDLLIRTADSDLYPENADLVFLHDYGPTALVRKIVERLRARTTSEIVMWTSHVQSSEDPAALRKDRDQRSKDLIAIAADNHCMLIDLRSKWLKMLADEHHEPGWYLADGVHMKESTGAFAKYGNFIAEDLAYVPDAGVDPLNGTITEHAFPVDPWKGDLKAFEFDFVGNRVEATFGSDRNFWKGSPTKVLLDGRDMGSFDELFRHGRVSSVVSWMPMILKVGHDTLPVEETWTLTFLEGTKSDGKPVVYRVDGSVTGFDGIGTSTNDFRSKSGRVTIAAKDFHVWQFDYFGIKDHQPKLEARAGMWTTWRTTRSFNDTFTCFHRPGERVTIVAGCTNGPHRLTFVPTVPGKLPQIEKLTVYRPAKSETDSATAPAVRTGRFHGTDPRATQPREVAKPPLRVLFVGAHPDDTDILCPAASIRLVKAGARVRWLSMTNGDRGHQFDDAVTLARRRRAETQAAARITGIEAYMVSDTSDCHLVPSLEERAKMTKVIREFKPHVIVTHRTGDYHPDHRATGQIVMDATYLSCVPLWAEEYPCEEGLVMPAVFFYMDRFSAPTPSRCDLLIGADDELRQSAEALACHASQLFEWLPPEKGLQDVVPPASDPAARVAFAKKHWVDPVHYGQARKYAKEIVQCWPDGAAPKSVECFEVSEYCRLPAAWERRELEKAGFRFVPHKLAPREK